MRERRLPMIRSVGMLAFDIPADQSRLHLARWPLPSMAARCTLRDLKTVLSLVSGDTYYSAPACISALTHIPRGLRHP